MIYALDFLLEKQATPAIVEHQTLKVTKGLVYKVEFHFPPGCAGLAHLAVFDGGHQVWPSSPGETFHTDNFNISFEDVYMKLAAPYQFDFYGYNEDTLWPHTVYCRIAMVSKDIFMARWLPTLAYDHFIKLMREEQKMQEERRKEILAEPFPWLLEK